MAYEGDEDELRENRFSYLLQPIRDLAANWDIDIAAELEEYLDELDNITFTIEGCGPALNFAEAALLIQGTTCVFSKKVEHLHNLVYQALDTIINKKQKEKAAATRKGDKATAAAEADLDDADTFFDLAATVEQTDDIDLAEEEEPAVKEVVRPPPEVLALEDAATGEGDGDAGCYRVAQWTVHASGALLLEGGDGAAYDQQLRLRRGAGRHAGPSGAPGAGPSAAAAAAGGRGGDEAADAGWLMSQELVPVGAGGAGGEDAEMWEGGGGDYDDGGYDDDGGIDLDDGLPALAGAGGALAAAGGAEAEPLSVPDWMAAAADAAGTADHQQLQQGEAGVPGTEQQQQGEDAAPQTATRGRRAARQRARAGERPAAAYYDPWEPLDPSDAGSLPVRPLQVRRPKKAACKRSGAALAFLPAPSASGALLPTARQGAAGGALGLNASSRAACKALVDQLYHKDLAYVVERLVALRAASEATGRGAGQRQAARRLAGAGLAPQVHSALDWGEAEAAAQQEQQLLAADQAEAEAMPPPDWDDGGDDGGWEGPGLDALEEAAAAGGGAGWGAAGGWGPDLGGSAAGAAADPGSLTYEELCRAHIEQLIAAAAAQQVQTDLQVRVSSWRQRIDPILRQEEDRSAFDIHEYGSALLQRLETLTLVTPGDAGDAQPAKVAAGRSKAQQQQEAGSGDVYGFGEVVAADNPYEVCRSFAAMLQLVNNRNVNIVPTEDDGQPFQLQLLSTDMLHEQMGEKLTAGTGDAVAAEAAEPGAGDKGNAGGGKGNKGGGRKGGAKGSSKGPKQPLQALDNLMGGGNEEDGGEEEEYVPVKQPAAKRAKTGVRRAAAA